MTPKFLLPLALLAAPLTPGEHRFQSAGVTLWYKVAGAERGVPVVFLHGGPGQGSMSFQRYAGPALERRLRMVYLDQRGSGRSERPKDQAAYSMAILVEDVERLRRELGAERIALVGHSFGTAIGMEYAAKYPDRVTRLVLAAGIPDIPAMIDAQCERLGRTDAEAYARASAGVAAGARPRCDPFRAYPGKNQEYVNRNMFPDLKTAAMVDEADEADGLKNSGELSRAMFDQGLLQYRFARPEALTMPVLVLAGAQDHQAVAGPQRAFAAKLPRGRYVEYAGRGHFMWVEDPERFARDVAAFVGG
ncbi:alpha/beta fold hydrolase [Sphingomonas lenta]|uniref:AB hydrolase-1 domain-containing protein n=1 Tax=Sphingomonas lenta TaxID=1141887 RepID=A0A2A2SBJ3_9SPHN|nr:alpha/beta hydrolase [Sphingomonas lenta]PAX06542.1 hypothetical protein CKY28_15420 [Sphingomonas lenta]